MSLVVSAFCGSLAYIETCLCGICGVIVGLCIHSEGSDASPEQSSGADVSTRLV